MKFLSIIIPVYNVERYLKKCLDSCVNQDVSRNDYEIICINDGSSDNSEVILREYASEFLNIKIISQTNKGLSVARNNGLRNAAGEYIWFVDSDDSISFNILSKIKDKLSSKPDLLQLNYQQTYEDDKNTEQYIFPNVTLRTSGKDILSNNPLPAPAQFTIYKRDFLLKNNLFFYPSILHEDSEFKPRATYYAQSIDFFEPIAYNYLQRKSGSITSSFKLKNGVDIITVMNNLHEFSLKVVKEDSCRKGIYNQIGSHVNTLLYGLRSLNIKEKAQVLDLLEHNKHIFKDLILSTSLKYNIEGILLSINIKFAICCHKIFR